MCHSMCCGVLVLVFLLCEASRHQLLFLLTHAQVRYERLEKGTFVEFQPLSRGFHEAVGEDVKQVGV